MLVTPRFRPRRATSPARTRRSGFTLAELVVALMLFGMIGGAILSVVMRQQRFYRSSADIIRLQGQLRQGTSILPADLRAISTSDTLVNSAATRFNGDIYGRGDWFLEFRRTFGSSLICAKRPAAPLDTIWLYPKSTGAIAALTSWTNTPQTGDSVLVLDDWTMLGPGDDRWQAYEVLDVTPVTGAKGCPWKGQTAGDSTSAMFLSDTGRTSYKVTLKTPLSKTILVGAPVRFFRRARYELYQAPDTLWYLGYSDCLRTYATECSDVTPVAGPYRPYTGVASENGLVFAYYDSLGNALDATAESRRVARIDVLMRSQIENVTRTGAGSGSTYADSTLFSIAVRNRR